MIYKIVNQNVSIINICDCIIYDIKQNIANLEKSFNFSIEFLYNFNQIKFNDLKEIIKAFNKNNFVLCVSLLETLKAKAKKQIKFYCTS